MTHLLCPTRSRCDRRLGAREQEILSCVLPTRGATTGGAWGHPGPTAVRLGARISTDLCCRRRHASIRIFIAGGGPQAGGNYWRIRYGDCAIRLARVRTSRKRAVLDLQMLCEALVPNSPV